MHVLEIVSLMLREQVGFYNAGFTLNTCYQLVVYFTLMILSHSWFN